MSSPTWGAGVLFLGRGMRGGACGSRSGVGRASGLGTPVDAAWSGKGGGGSFVGEGGAVLLSGVGFLARWDGAFRERWRCQGGIM